MNYFEKKQWIRLGICAVVLLAVTLLVSGLIGDNLKYNLKDEPAPEAVTEFKYSAEKETNFSVIHVYANVENGDITECKITSEGKKKSSDDYMTDAVRADWAKAIVENDTAQTDAITGATLSHSSKAVVDAVNDILKQSGAIKEEPKEPSAKEEPKETGAKEDPKKATETPAGTAATGETKKYSAEKRTDYSTIKVTVKTAGGKITACKIASQPMWSGSDLMTEEIRKAWENAIVENGTAEVDAITGATLEYSSKAVVAAVNDILKQMAADQ